MVWLCSPFIKDMRPQDKVTCLAFLVCGGIIGILFAKVLAVPQVNREAGQESAKI